MGSAPDNQDRRILDIAVDHLRRMGLRKMTVVDIAADAGMTHANVYRYFPSKLALVDQIIDEWLRSIEGRLAEIMQAPDPADDKLERFLTYLPRAYAEKSARDGNVFAAYLEAKAAGREVATRHSTRIRSILGQIVEEGIATRVFTLPDRRRIEALVLDAMFRFIDPGAMRDLLRESSGEGLGGLDMRRDRLVRMVIRGLAPGRG